MTEQAQTAATPSPGTEPPRSESPARKPLVNTAALAALLLTSWAVIRVLRATTELNLETPFPVIVLGVITGMTYGLLAVGLVLIYRTNRIINFAHGQIGAFGAAFFGLAAVKWQIPYWVAFPFALMVAGAVGYTAETAVVRRLRNAPRLMSVVATLGIGQFLVVFAALINNQASAGAVFPLPPGLPEFRVGELLITPAYSGMLLLSPVAVLAIAMFLRFSKYGLAMRAAAANPEAARMAGIFSGRMSGLAWAIAGGLSAFSAILTQPTQGFTSGESFGPSLLLRALAGAVLARMNNLPVALTAGIGLGVIEQLIVWNYPESGLVEVALFFIIVVALLAQRQSGGREEEKGSWASVEALPPVPDALRRIWLVRNLSLVVGLVVAAVMVALPFWVTNTQATDVVAVMTFVIIGLSVVILSGMAGQLTLGQFAVGAIGAVVSYYVSSRTGNFPLSVLYGGLCAGAVSVVLGIPALRSRGLLLTVTTLSFGLVAPTLVVSNILGDSGTDPGRPILPGGFALETGKEYYWFALAVLVLALLVARNVRSSGFGRLLIAVRDNEDNARAFTVRASLVKVQGYLIAGFIAGIGGAAYGHSLSSLDGSAFPAKASIDVVVMTVIGGVGVLSGPLLGALLVIGVPTFLPLGSLGLAATYLGQLILILYLPGGLASLVGKVRDRLIRRIARWRGVDYEAAYANEEAAAEGEAEIGTAVVSPHTSQERAGPVAFAPVLLEAESLRKSFGGVHAVAGVSFAVREGETVGLIGPNGAGKTTTFEILGGFVRPDSGTVRFLDRDVTSLSPEARARMGLIRSFQDAALFQTMTVTECVMLALERVHPTSFVLSLTGWKGGERRKEHAARQLVSFMGLDRYRDKQIRELSTGTRRITEIACLVALEPTFLLLDEPSSGIAQRETEALGGLLENLKRELGLTLLVIEHDMPLIMGISDRIVAMADGRVICEGTPEVVMADPQVADAYLGGNIEAIERSGTRTDSTGDGDPEPRHAADLAAPRG